MGLATGTRLGPYEVAGLIGAGGMGEVYKARDTRLGRTVALKVLPEGVAADPERRRRFEQEARAASALNHPHICVLHDIGDAIPTGGSPIPDPRSPIPAPVSFLVMEHLEGQTLAERLEGKREGRRPLKVDEALPIGIQIAEALAAAHRQGIIHRDLKPANVMLTKGGAGSQGVPQVKLLDFGLARLTEASAAGLKSETQSASGVVVGTVPYMAPEQLTGRPADARTDLFAFGAVLYEMLTGTRAFGGDSSAAVIAAILEHEPEPVSRLQPLTPPALERVVRRCLAKDPDQRWQSAADVADELRWIGENSASSSAPQAPSGRGRIPVAAGMIIIGLVGALVGAGSLWWLRRPAVAQAPVVRSSLSVRPADEVGGFSYPLWCPTPGGSRAAFAWTPDGRALVFIGWRAATAAETTLAPKSGAYAGLLSRVYVREMNRQEARPLSGTEGATGPIAVSPDGLSASFWRARAIHRVPLAGGPVTVLAEPVPRAPARVAWGRSGLVIFDGSPDGALWQSTGHGPPSQLTTLREGEILHGLPQLIAEDRVLLYTVRRDPLVWGREEVVAQLLSTGERTRVIPQAADARLLPTGHLAFMRRGVLWVAPFDSNRRVLAGETFAVEESVAQALVADNDSNVTGVGQFDVSRTGTLAYLTGPVPSYPDFALVRIDRDGRTTEIAAPHRPYLGWVRRAGSPPHLYADSLSLTERAVLRHDLSRAGSLSKVLVGLGGSFAVRPDGRGVAYWSVGGGIAGVAWQPADGGPPGMLVPGSLQPVSWTPDGRLLLVGPESRIWIFSPNGPEPRLIPLSDGTSLEEAPEVSPDGRWLAFTANETGRREVYVRPFPGPGQPTQVTVDGGTSPAWNPNGSELFFVTWRSTSKSCPTGPFCLHTVPVDLNHGPRIGVARRLFDFDNAVLSLQCSPMRCYEVSDDGMSSYANRSVHPPRPRPIVTDIALVQNWFEELKAKVPSK